MPKDIEKALTKGAKELGLKTKSRRGKRYIYGTMERLGLLTPVPRKRKKK